MSAYLVSETATIPAAPQFLFDIVADPAMHPVIDGSGTVKAVRAGGAGRLALGSHFGMDMKMGAPYKISNTVVEFEDGRRIAWRHFNGHVWRYLFEPVEGGTEVTEQWDARPVWNRVALRLAGFPKRNRAGIRGTLKRLAEVAAERGCSMFADTRAFSGFAVDDVAAAQQFYGDALGIRVSEANGMLTLHLAGERDTLIYPKPDHVPAAYTILNFPVGDIEAAVDELVERGVVFEHYDFVDERGINRRGGPLIAWFKDPAGNVLSVIQE